MNYRDKFKKYLKNVVLTNIEEVWYEWRIYEDKLSLLKHYDDGLESSYITIVAFNLKKWK